MRGPLIFFERFPKEIIEAFKSGLLKQAHLQHFYGLPNRQAMRKLFKAIVEDHLNSSEARALANRLDERWLSGDRELLTEMIGKDPAFKEILGSEVTTADLVKKSKCTLSYTDLTRFSELIPLLYQLVKSGEFRTTLTQCSEQQ